jgi:hypothetical protein
VDLAAAPLQKEASSKKTKRKSHTAPRKYNPCEPRIITLDSLGLKHSPTCTNLKEYLIAEIKSKHGIDIPQPGSLGMTATSIPEQDNFCDCGLFLLSYIEMFLKQPEKFIHGILQLQDVKELFSPWPRASEMRCRGKKHGKPNAKRDNRWNMNSKQIFRSQPEFLKATNSTVG